MIVVDASVALAIVLDEAIPQHSAGLPSQIAEHGGLVPWLWRLEVLNTLLMVERRGRITRDFRRQAQADLEALSIVVDETNPETTWRRTLAIAEQCNLTTYDASYVELAERSRRPIGTLDGKLRLAAATLNIDIAG